MSTDTQASATARYHLSLQLAAAVKEARENLQYWKVQQELRSDPDAKAKAAGLASAWKSTLAAREAKLAALQPTPA